MEALQVWVYLRLEVSTESGMVKRCWLTKCHEFRYPPTVGLELDYRTATGHTIMLERVLKNPDPNIQGGGYSAIQDSWISIGVGEKVHWERHGWIEQPMSEEDQKR